MNVNLDTYITMNDCHIRIFINNLVNNLLQEFNFDIKKIKIYNKNNIHIFWDDDFDGPEVIFITDNLDIETIEYKFQMFSNNNYKIIEKTKKHNDINEFIYYIKYSYESL